MAFASDAGLRFLMATHPPLVFIHGLYTNVDSWKPWLDRAKKAGFDARAVEWPGHKGSPEELRAKPPAGLGALTFDDILVAVRDDIVARADNPVLIGHSIGGLLALKLLSMGVGRAAVAITPAPPRGIVSTSSVFVRANFPHVNPFSGNKPIRMTKKRFFFTFGNASTRAESDAAFDQWVVPESRNIPRSTLTHQGAVDLGATQAPRLLIGGEVDHLIPEALVKKIARAYAKAGAPADYRQAAGKSHLVCNQWGWEGLADDVFHWADANG